MSGEFTRFNIANRISTQTFSKLKEKDRFSQAFSLFLNYWEIKPSLYESKLHELALKDVSVVCTFVPWAHVETDIFHSLKKFLRAAFAVRLHVRLMVMPELGVNYPNVGFPKDVISELPHLAVDRFGHVIYNVAAPNIFPLPSFSSPEILKRFGNFLIKVGSILGEIFTEVGSSDFVEVVVTNSLFNYYRSHGLKAYDHGDYSAAHVMAFRDFVDREYHNPQNAADTEQFKMQLYESYNRHCFFTHVERLLREKTELVFSRRSSHCALRHIDLYNPECDPDAGYQGLVTELFDLKPSVQRFYEGILRGAHRGEVIYLGNAGIFRRFSDQEKCFLVLASLIHSGEVAFMAEDLLQFSGGFQRKLRGLVAFLEERKLVRQRRVAYVAASKFAMTDATFQRITAMTPGVLGVVNSLASYQKNVGDRLVFLDPKSVLRLMDVIQLLSLAKAGKVVAVPRPQEHPVNFTSDAMIQYEKFMKGRRALKINLGLAYEVVEYELGFVVFYDAGAFWRAETIADEEASLSRFFQALMGLAEVRSLCSVSDRRLHVTSYGSEEDSTQRLLFLINPTTTAIDVKLGFSDMVRLSSLPQGEQTEPLVGKSFEMTIPALGVFSLQMADLAESDVAQLKQHAENVGTAPAGFASPQEVVQWT